MSQLGRKSEGYSTLTWYMCEDINWQFIYATQNEIVLVYVDYIKIKDVGSVEENVIEQGLGGDEIHCFKVINIKDEHPNVDGRLSPIEHLAVRIAEFRKILVEVYGYNPMIHGVFISITSLVNVDKAIEPLKQSPNTDLRYSLITRH